MIGSFTVENHFTIKGRTGTVVTRSEEAAIAAWTAGQRWWTRDWATYKGLRVQVLSIERYAVPPDHPANNADQSMILDIDPVFVFEGQVWHQERRGE